MTAGLKKSVGVFIPILFALISKVDEGETARGHKISVQFQRIECGVYNKTVVRSFNCTLHKDKITNELVVSSYLILAKDVNNTNCKNKVLFERNGIVTELHNIEINLCQALSQRFDSFFFRLVSDEIHRISNMPLECPLKANVLYQMRNFTLNSKYFPSFLPNMKWSSFSNFTINKRRVISFNSFDTDTDNEEGPNATPEPSASDRRAFLTHHFFCYLNDNSRTDDTWEKYSSLKEAFVAFNTPLTSSAPVERLFSFAGIVNSPRRQSISDLSFEKLVLLKANSKWG